MAILGFLTDEAVVDGRQRMLQRFVGGIWRNGWRQGPKRFGGWDEWDTSCRIRKANKAIKNLKSSTMCVLGNLWVVENSESRKPCLLEFVRS